jgi:hypothetical protein
MQDEENVCFYERTRSASGAHAQRMRRALRLARPAVHRAAEDCRRRRECRVARGTPRRARSVAHRADRAQNLPVQHLRGGDRPDEHYVDGRACRADRRSWDHHSRSRGREGPRLSAWTSSSRPASSNRWSPGRRFDEVPLITSRICGICSPNHAVTAIKATRSRARRRGERAHRAPAQAAGLRFLPAEPRDTPLPLRGPGLRRSAERVPARRDASRDRRAGAAHQEARQRPDDARRRATGASGDRGHRAASRASRRPPARSVRDRARRVIDDAVATAELFSAFSEFEFETTGEMLALRDDADYGDLRRRHRRTRRRVDAAGRRVPLGHRGDRRGTQ